MIIAAGFEYIEPAAFFWIPRLIYQKEDFTKTLLADYNSGQSEIIFKHITYGDSVDLIAGGGSKLRPKNE